MKEIKLNEYWIHLFQAVENSLSDFIVLFEFWKSGDATEQETQDAYNKAITAIEEAEFKSTLNKPEDELPAVMQINPGAGGTESQDWAEMLLRMYLRYSEKNNYKIQILDEIKGEEAGIGRHPPDVGGVRLCPSLSAFRHQTRGRHGV